MTKTVLVGTKYFLLLGAITITDTIFKRFSFLAMVARTVALTFIGTMTMVQALVIPNSYHEVKLSHLRLLKSQTSPNPEESFVEQEEDDERPIMSEKLEHMGFFLSARLGAALLCSLGRGKEEERASGTHASEVAQETSSTLGEINDEMTTMDVESIHSTIPDKEETLAQSPETGGESQAPEHSLPTGISNEFGRPLEVLRSRVSPLPTRN